MRSYFDLQDEQHKPKPLILDAPKIDDPCADPACAGGHLEYGPTPTVTFALRCDACGKEPVRP